MIYILTGDIRTGKTSALLDWINTSTSLSGTNRNDVDGLLCPDNENGKRYFLKVKSKEEFLLEVETEAIDQEVVTVGPFRFLKSAFQKGNDYLITKGKQLKSQYLIIDELGKLELKNEGLHVSAKTLIPDFMLNANSHLILVVRESLLDEILKHYKIKAYSVLKKEDLELLG